MPNLSERAITGWIALAAGAVYLVRAPWASFDSLWAEDGAEFLQAALHGASPVQPYAGYLHLIPRVIAAVVVWLPVAVWPAAVTVLCAGVVAGVSAAVFVATRRLGLATRSRVLIGLVTVLAPALGYEVIGNAANLHTVLLWAAPWVFLARPQRWGTAAAWAGVVALICLTETQAILFLPLLLLFWRDRYRWPMRIVGLATGAAQVLVYLANGRQPGAGTVDAVSALAGYVLQAVIPAWIGSVRIASILVVNAGWWVGVFALVPFVWAAVALWRKGSNVLRWSVAGIWASSVLLWLAGYAANMRAEDAYAQLNAEALLSVDQLRYGVVPGMLLLTLVILYTDANLRPVAAQNWDNRVALTMLAAAALIGLPLGQFSPHQQAESWSAAVSAAVEQCRGSGETVQTLRVAPTFMSWSITVPCEKLD